MRLDNYLFEHSFAQSRNKAKELIEANLVLVDGLIMNKPSFEITNHEVKVLENRQYVGRAGKKLKYFLDESNIDINNLECLDIGSSTGGFCEVLLDAGAKSVFCIDVGSNQLHESLRTNPKVTLFENLDIRDFQTKQKFDLITCDVSFISVLKILDKIDELAKKEIIILFKPQFEVGANIKRDKFGVVKDEKAIIRAIDLFISNTVMKGWKLLEQKNSKLQGKDGNKEILFRFAK